MTDLIQKLAAPFSPDSIHWRVGSTTKDKTRGLALAYVDARDVMERLDEAVGPENWQDRYEVHGPRTICYLSIRFGDEWITKADGAGDTDVEAEKGSISDAFKRAAVKWGIGRYLYDVAAPWVELEPRGRSYAIKQSEYAKLAKLLGGKPKPANGNGKPADDTPFDDRPTDTERRMAKSLIEKLQACSSTQELDRLKSSDDFAETYKSLPPELKDSVASAGKSMRAALEPVDNLSAA